MLKVKKDKGSKVKKGSIMLKMIKRAKGKSVKWEKKVKKKAQRSKD